MTAGDDLAAWIAPARTALLVVDMQADFAAPEGAMAHMGADVASIPPALAAAERLAASARAANVPVIFVGLVTRPGEDSAVWLEQARRQGLDAAATVALCRAGSGGAAFVGPTPAAGDRVVAKRRYSAFLGTGLEAELRRDGLDTLVVCGLTTECCVFATALDGYQRDFHVFVAGDACAAYGADVHAAALKALAMNGPIVVDAEAVTAAWRGRAPPAARETR